MPRVLTVVGARPQFIKAAPVSRALTAGGVEEYLVHTGQHYDAGMSDVFFRELGIREPDLNLSAGSGSHARQTSAMLVGLAQAIEDQKPDWVLIYGDTNSTLAGALAAAKLHIPVAHVEAGLRSFNRRMPEEINRIVADALGDLLFVPTETARKNLTAEGVSEDRIVWTGDVMYDAMLHFRDQAGRESGVLEELNLTGKPYVVATIHRAENTDDPDRLEAILSGLAKVAQRIPVVLPLHPRTRKFLQTPTPDPRLLSSALHFIDPVGFLDMVRLEAGAAVIATDSGGVQKEAFFHRVPCVTLRDETEWVELVELGWNRVVPPTSAEAVSSAILSAVGAKGRDGNPYGDGRAAERIASVLGDSD